jgi:hypothetical protein
MKHPDEYAWELRRGLEDGDAHKDYIWVGSYKDSTDHIINEDGLQYIERFMRRVIKEVKNERTTKNR